MTLPVIFLVENVKISKCQFFLDIRNLICGSFHKLHFGHFISALIFFGIVHRGPVAG